MKSNIKLIAQNKKAYHDYFILEKYEAGISLKGTEVKSLRENKCNIKDSYVSIENNEAILKNMHIGTYEQGNIFNHDPLRDKKLLLHKYEINKLIGASAMQGQTLIPVKIYFKNSYVKVEISVAKGKKLYDKRDALAKKTQKREAEKDFKLKLQI